MHINFKIARKLIYDRFILPVLKDWLDTVKMKECVRT